MATARSTFGEDDVKRWERVYSGDPAFCISKVSRGEINGGYQISELSRSHEYLGLIAIARDDYGTALGHFAASASTWAHLLERYVDGVQIDGDLLYRAANGFIFAAASGEEHLIDRLSSAYERAFPEARASSRDELHIGMAIRALCLKDVERASQWLTPIAREDTRTTAFIEAIIEQNEERFREAVARAVGDWHKRIRSERLQKFPDAVCDDRMIGWIRLAERVWGRRPQVDLTEARIPPEIFDEKAVPVEGTL